MRDVVGLNFNPRKRTVFLCMDEKTPVQALDRTQPILPFRPGQAGRHIHDQKRNGTNSPGNKRAYRAERHRCICITCSIGGMLLLRWDMIQSDPAMRRKTIRMPNASAMTLFVLSGPLEI